MCMNAYKYSLANPLVQAAREEFYRQRHARCGQAACKLSFEQIWELLCDQEIGIRALAARAGIHVSSMSRLYENHFMRFFGNLTFEERAQKLRERIYAERIAELSKALPDVPWIQRAAHLAERAGLNVKPCIREDGPGRFYVSPKFVLIEGVRCAGHPIASALKRRRTNRAYGEVRFYRSSLNAAPVHVAPLLIQGAPERALVIPSADVAEHRFAAARRDAVAIIFPLRNFKIGCPSKALLDVNRYWDAWHLIREMRSPEAATG